MATVRKKWRLQVWTAGGSHVMPAGSKVDAYRKVQDYRTWVATGVSRATHVVVQVTEPDLPSWVTYERIPLRESARMGG